MADNRVRLYGQNGPGLTRNYAYNSSSNNNSNSDRTRNRERRANNNSNTDRTRNMERGTNNTSSSNNNGLSREARELNNLIHRIYGGGGPQSPGRKPKAVNVSKYQKMLNNLENKNKNKNNNNNNKPNNENKNVVSWLNKGMAESKKSKIPKNKRVFLLTDLTRNGKIKHVWDRRFLNGLIESAETLPVSRRREVRENNDPFFTSPLTRNKFSKNDIKAYPPTNATKGIIKQIMNRRVLESKVNKFISIRNRDYLARSNILDTIKRGIRKGDITTETQVKIVGLIYITTGRELLISGHKRGGDYYTAYVDGKFKPHHIKFMKDAPFIVSLLYDTTLTGRFPARFLVPLHKLPETATTYLSKFAKYYELPINRRPNNSNSKKENQKKILQQRTVILNVLRRIVKVGVYSKSKLQLEQAISTLTNSNLRNKLSEYDEWYELVKNASS